MNQARRCRLAAILTDLTDAHSRLESLTEEEQEAFDNTPESLQTDEKQEFIDTLDNNLTALQDVIEELQSMF